MSTQIKASTIQVYQGLLYDRALHPELFSLKARRVFTGKGEYELEVWLMNGAHLLRFERRGLCVSELITDQEANLPNTGIVVGFPCTGERDIEHRFEKDRVTYMTTVQTETLSENLFLATTREMRQFAREADALYHGWTSDAGSSLSVIDVQRMNREVHVQCYHLLASTGLVLRTQTLFEHD